MHPLAKQQFATTQPHAPLAGSTPAKPAAFRGVALIIIPAHVSFPPQQWGGGVSHGGGPS